MGLDISKPEVNAKWNSFQVSFSLLGLDSRLNFAQDFVRRSAPAEAKTYAQIGILQLGAIVLKVCISFHCD